MKPEHSERSQAVPETSAARTMRQELARGQFDAFRAFSKAAFADGVLPRKTKELIAVAVAHVITGPAHAKRRTTMIGRLGSPDAQRRAVPPLALSLSPPHGTSS